MTDLFLPETTRSIVFIDSRVQDTGTLLKGFPPDTQVVYLKAGEDGLELMANILGERGEAAQVHVLAHGSEGQLWLGSTFLDTGTLAGHGEALAAIGRGMTADGDLLVYACDLAQGQAGAQFISNLAALTGADVAASDDRTGASGDWQLEISTGHIEAQTLVSNEAAAGYAHALATITVTNGNDSGAGSLRNAIATANAGDTVTFNGVSTVTLSSGELLLNKNLVIDGDLDNNGTPDVTIDANYTSRVLEITQSSTVTLDGLVLTHGSLSGQGGGGGPTASSNGGSALGAGIFNAGTLTINNSSVTANGAAGGGGGGGSSSQRVTGGGGGGGPLIDGANKGTGASGGPSREYSPGPGTLGAGGMGGTSIDMYNGGQGGSTSGGAGASNRTMSYTDGGHGGTATSGALVVGGGGGGAGWAGVTRAGGMGVGGIYNAATGSITVIGTSAITNNVGAGGGGGGGNNSYDPSGNQTGGAGGVGAGGVYNEGIFKITSANFALMAGNNGASGTGGFTGNIISGISLTGASPAPVMNVGGAGTQNLSYVPPPTLVSASFADNALKVGETSTVTFVFSSAVTGFSTAGLTVPNGAIAGLSTADGGTTWTGTFTPNAGVTAAANVITVDLARVANVSGGLPGAGTADSSGYAIDTTLPAVLSIVRQTPASGLTNADSLVYRVTFSEAVTNVDPSDFTVSGGSTAFAAGMAPAGGNAYDVTVAEGDLANYNGTVTLGFASGQNVQDSAGNALASTTPTGTNEVSYALDNAPPAVVITSDMPQLRIGQTATVTFTFTKDPGSTFTWDGAIGDVVVSGGTLSAIAGSGLVRTATFTPTGSTNGGTASITVTASSYTDAASNNGGAGLPPTLGFDTLAPTLGIASDVPRLRIGETATITFTFSEDPGASFTWDGTVGDVVVSGGTLSAIAGSGLVRTATFTPATGADNSTASITVAAGSYTDAAGNNGAAGTTPSLTFDTRAPTLSSSTPLDNAAGTSTTANLTLTFSEDIAAAEGMVKLMKTSDNSEVEAFDVNTGEGSLNGTLSIAGTTLTLNPHDDLALETGYYLLADFGVVKDSAGQYFAGITAPTALNFTTMGAPSSGGNPVPPSTTVDGVPVSTAPGPNGATVITVPVVTATRPDTPGTASPLADIPIARAADGHAIVQIGVPTGVGITAEGLSTSSTGSAALAELVFRIERVTGANSEPVQAVQTFFASLPADEHVSVQIIKPTVGAGFDPAVPLVITGSTNPADGKQAIIIDARDLPAGTVIQVDNIDFITVVGNVRLIGGAGQNIAIGDAASQSIVLGPDDDVIHGGGGNDTVGSEGGDDQVYGDAGDDIVFGGAGNDLLSGGTGSDRLNGGTGFDVAIQEGKKTDYTITLDGAGIKLTHTASGVSDWLVDVEQVRFESGPSLTVAHSAAEEAAAYLFQKWIGRDLNQGEGAVIQSLTGMSAEQVATLFTQVFPTQTAGKTSAQLLDGMASAGAIRVDAVRDVIVNGDAGNNTIAPTMGLARYVDGGAGTDTVVIPATLVQSYVQHNTNGSYTLQRLTDGAMLDITRVERVSFTDTKLALDLNGNAGQAAKLLGALAGPGMLGSKGVVGEVIRALDAGASSQTVASLGLQLLGVSTPTQVAQTLWTNVVGRAGTSGELKLLTDIMASGVSAADLVVMAANLDANAVRIDLVGLAAKGIEFA